MSLDNHISNKFFHKFVMFVSQKVPSGSYVQLNGYEPVDSMKKTSMLICTLYLQKEVVKEKRTVERFFGEKEDGGKNRNVFFFFFWMML